VALADGRAAVVQCDRGSLDGLAYWPDAWDSFFSEVSTTREAELARYRTVIHLRTPSSSDGYNHQNPLRTESVMQARAIDEKIAEAWSPHPRRIVVPSAHSFMEKALHAIVAIEAEVPACCAPLHGNGGHAVASKPERTAEPEPAR
jgi:hypothetical protein